ncbi:MAG: ABC-F family ATP-binding cassette domain-containing protein [Anaerolineales bacterium]|nr:ABC-F family ATP-binding cassette domain-containing protein [Anaerolineales bacterium]
MIAINLDRVAVTYISEPIFQDLSWEIHDDRTVGLVGPNGCGKSTLLRLITGELESDTGFVVRRRHLSIGHLPQDPQFQKGRTIWEEALSASTALMEVEEALSAVEDRLADPDVYTDEDLLARTLERQAGLLERFTQLGGHNYQGRVRSILTSLGFSESDFALLVDTLSGGQKKLVGLAKLLVTGPDLLLLDEPDNHLDLDGKAFLERFIQEYKGAVVIISHDRYLLDMVVDEIVELEDGKLTAFTGNYSEYVFEKQSMLLRQQQLYQAQHKEIVRLEQAAKRLLTWGKVYDNAKFSQRGKSILNRLEKIEKIDRPVLERRQMGLTLPGWRGSEKVLEIVDLDKVFPAGANEEDELILFAGLNLLIWRGERVGLVGPNGAGKSVLFRLVLNAAGQQGQQELPTNGCIKIGPNVRLGYYAQEHETLDPARTLIDTVRQAEALSEEGAVRFLNRFLFTYEQVRGPVSDLSGGERSRLQMALIMLSGANFLLLDEPTNNLDIVSAEVLESALTEMDGTVLVISHDRYFLDRVVDRIVELDDGDLQAYIGGYSDYQAARAG